MSFKELTDEQQRWIAGVSDYPLKMLLRAYFGQFRPDSIGGWCANSGISGVPAEYKTFGKSASINKHLPHAKSIWYYYRGMYVYVALDIVPSGLKWEDTMIRDDIKATMAMMIQAVKISFDYLKSCESVLKNITLLVDETNLTIKIVDSTFPGYEFNNRIGFQVTLSVLNKPEDI